MSGIEDRIEIREAGPEDVEALVDDLWFPLAHEMEELDSFNALIDSEDVREGSLGHKGELIEDDDYVFFLAFVDNQRNPVGFVGLEETDSPPIFDRGRHTHVHEIYVKEGYRGSGIATRLMEKAEEWAEDRGCEYLDLMVNADNDAAISLYEEMGFDVKRYNMLKKID